MSAPTTTRSRSSSGSQPRADAAELAAAIREDLDAAGGVKLAALALATDYRRVNEQVTGDARLRPELLRYVLEHGGERTWAVLESWRAQHSDPQPPCAAAAARFSGEFQAAVLEDLADDGELNRAETLSAGRALVAGIHNLLRACRRGVERVRAPRWNVSPAA